MVDKAIAVATGIKTVTNGLPEVVDNLKLVTDISIFMIDELTQKVLSLAYRAEELKSTANTCKEDIHEMAIHAYAFVDRVDDLFYHGGRRDIGKIKRALIPTDNKQEADFQLLVEFLDTLGRYFSKAEEEYQGFKNACEKATTSCMTASEECRKKSKKQMLKKRLHRSWVELQVLH